MMQGSALAPIIAAAVVPLAVVILILSGSFVPLVEWRPPILWTNQFGVQGTSNGATSAASNANGLIITGYLNWSDLSASGISMVRKYDPNGGIQWTRYMSNSTQLFSSIAIGLDGAYVLDNHDQNITILKYDFDGNLQWTRNIHTGSPGLFSQITTSDNQIYIAGYSGYSLTNQSLSGSQFLRKYDSNGNVIWTSEKPDNLTAPFAMWGLSVGRSTIYVLTTAGLSGYDLSGRPIWSDKIGDYPFINLHSITGDGTNAYISADARSTTFSPSRGFVTSYDESGKIVWNTNFDSPDQSAVGDSYAWEDSSGVYVTFDSISRSEYVIKFDHNGAQQWSFQLPTSPGQGITSRFSFEGSATPSGFALVGVAKQSGSSSLLGIVQEFSGASSLILLSIGPPSSFAIVGGITAASGTSVLLFERYRRKRLRPKRVGPSPKTIPTTD